jgi:hypothetical protein
MRNKKLFFVIILLAVSALCWVCFYIGSESGQRSLRDSRILGELSVNVSLLEAFEQPEDVARRRRAINNLKTLIYSQLHYLYEHEQEITNQYEGHEELLSVQIKKAESIVEDVEFEELSSVLRQNGINSRD